MTTPLLAPIALILAACAAGCQDPYAAEHHAAPAPHHTATPRSTAAAVATAFAMRWINWDWRTLAAQQRDLAQLATGALATRLNADARTATVMRNKPANRGRVAVVSLKPGENRATGLVVTREESYTAGHADLGGERYRVYRIAVALTAQGWKVTAWAPQL